MARQSAKATSASWSVVTALAYRQRWQMMTTCTVHPWYPPQKMGDALRGVPNGPGVEKLYVNVVVTDTGKTELVCEDDLEPTDE